jgi:hypothetical protein
VHSGKGAGTFSLDKIVTQSQNDPDSALDGRDGHYMSEALQRKLIEKKLVGKDEATVMQEIIDERSDAIEEVGALAWLCSVATVVAYSPRRVFAACCVCL